MLANLDYRQQYTAMSISSPESDFLVVPQEFSDFNNPYKPYRDGIMLKTYSDGTSAMKFPNNSLHTNFTDGNHFENSNIPKRYSSNESIARARSEFSRKADLIRMIGEKLIVIRETDRITEQVFVNVTLARQEIILAHDLPNKTISDLVEIYSQIPEPEV